MGGSKGAKPPCSNRKIIEAKWKQYNYFLLFFRKGSDNKVFIISKYLTKKVTKQMLDKKPAWTVGSASSSRVESSFPCKMDRSQGIRIDVFPWCCCGGGSVQQLLRLLLSLLVGYRVLQNPAFGLSLPVSRSSSSSSKLAQQRGYSTWGWEWESRSHSFGCLLL